MNIIGKSFYLENANMTFDWFSTDTLIHYRKNKHKTQKHGWTEKSITYKFNEYGFRSDNFNNKEGALFLGCSHTFGVGMPYNLIWSYLVSNELDLSCWSLAQLGASINTCYRLGSYWIPILKPKYIFVMMPEYSRREYFMPTYNNKTNIYTDLNQGLYTFNVNMNDDIDYTSFYFNMVSVDENNILNNETNINGLKYIAYENNIPIYFCNINQDINEPKNLARDLQHNGKLYHRNKADKFLDTIFGKIAI